MVAIEMCESHYFIYLSYLFVSHHVLVVIHPGKGDLFLGWGK